MNVYKRVMLLLTCGILLIGLITLRFDSAPKNRDSDNLPSVQNTPAALDDNPNNPSGEIPSPTEAVATPIPENTGEPVPTEPAVPENILLREAYPEIHELIENYLNAKLECTTEAFAKVVTDTSKVDLERVAEETQSIRSYDDIVCYTKYGCNDIDFIVYCTYTMNIVQIDSPVPAIDSFYIQYGEDGVPRVFGGNIEPDTLRELSRHNKDEDVVALIEETNTRMRKALAEDEDLRNFWDNLLKKVGEGEDNG